MLQIETQRSNGDCVLTVDEGARRRIADVLADWLSIYAGVQPTSLSRDNFDIVVELRRVLLSPDEAHTRSSSTHSSR